MQRSMRGVIKVFTCDSFFNLMRHLDHFGVRPDAGAGGQRAVDLTRQQRGPHQRKPHFVRGAQLEVRGRGKRCEIDVGFVEATELDEAVGARRHQFLGRMARCAEEGTELLLILMNRQQSVDLFITAVVTEPMVRIKHDCHVNDGAMVVY